VNEVSWSYDEEGWEAYQKRCEAALMGRRCTLMSPEWLEIIVKEVSWVCLWLRGTAAARPARAEVRMVLVNILEMFES
jgi:hypothetical protein